MKKNKHKYFPLKYILGLIIFTVSGVYAQTPIAITNGSLETGNDTGWTATGGWFFVNTDGDATKDGSYIGGTWGAPVGDFQVSQSVTGLSSGYYQVSCLMMVPNNFNRIATTQRLFANNNSVLFGISSDYTSGNLTVLNSLGENVSFANNVLSTADNGVFRTVKTIVQVTDGTLNFGVRSNGKGSALGFSFDDSKNGDIGFFKFDNFTVTNLSNVATLSGITLSAGALKSQFDPAQITYLAILPQGTTTVTPTATPSVPGTVISGTDAIDVTSGSGTSTITVTALDGNTTKTYTINYVVWSSATTLKLHSYTFANGATDSPYAGVAAVNGTLNGGGTIANGIYTNTSDGYVSLDGSALAINTYNSVSLEAYIKASVGLNNDDWVILSSFGNDGDNFLLMSNTRGGWLGTTCSAKANGVSSELAFFPKKDDDNLHHIVTILSNDSLKLYFDGVLLNKTGAASLLSNLGTSMAYLGKSPWGWDPLWKGTIDEFNIYEGELTTEQVSAHYQSMANKNITNTETAALNMYKNVVVRASGALTLTSPVNIESLRIQSGGTLLDNGNLTSSNISIQQYLTSGRNWYISSPVTNATSAVIDAANVSNKLYWYDQAHGTTAPWAQITDNTTNLSSLQGYITNVALSDTLRFNGPLNTAEKSITLHRTAGQTKEGFNLIGNPYPSYVSWDAAEKSNMESTIWYRTKNAGNTVYVFDTYNSAGQIGTGLNGEQINCNIPPLQAFWVRVKPSILGGDTIGSVTFRNTMRSHKGSQTVGQTTTPDVVRKISRSETNIQRVLRLQIANGDFKDEAIVVFNENALNTLDEYDSYKMFNNNVLIPEIYTISDATDLTINGLTNIESNAIIPLGFKTGQRSEGYTITSTQLSNFDNDQKVYLKDNLLNIEQELGDGQHYTFTSDPVTTNTRFAIIFKSQSITTDVSKNTLDQLKVSVNSNNQLCIYHPYQISENSSFCIFNSIGQKIEKLQPTVNATTISNVLPAGVYVLAIQLNGVNKSVKVLVK